MPSITRNRAWIVAIASLPSIESTKVNLSLLFLGCNLILEESFIRNLRPEGILLHMEIIDKVIEALSDGSWHDLNELSTRKGLINLSMTKLICILEFLAECDFIELSETGKGEPLRLAMEVKLQPDIQEFWTKDVEKGGKV